MFEKVIFPVKREPLIHNGQPTKRDIISREDTGEFISVVSEEYLLVENKLIIDNLLKEFKTLIDFSDIKAIQKNVFSSNNYFSFAFDLNYPKLEVKVNDYVGAVLKIENSYDGTSSLRVSMNAKRLVCSNGMTVNKALFSNKKKHIGNLKPVDVVREMMSEVKETGHNSFIELNETFKRMNEMQLTADIKREFINKVGSYQNYIVDAVTGKIVSESPKNLWDLYNCVTYVMTHEVDRSKAAVIKAEEDINKDIISLIN